MADDELWDVKVEGMKRRARFVRAAGLCGARDNGYGVCNDHPGHEGRFHADVRGGKLWASWSGESD